MFKHWKHRAVKKCVALRHHSPSGGVKVPVWLKVSAQPRWGAQVESVFSAVVAGPGAVTKGRFRFEARAKLCLLVGRLTG